MNNNVRKLTEGAMMVALIMGLSIVNRQFAVLISSFNIIFVPIPLIIYGVRYNYIDLYVPIFSVIFLSFIFLGVSMDFILSIFGCLVGYSYVYSYSKKLSKSTILIRVIIISAIGEIIATVALASLFGIDINASVDETINILNSVSYIKDMISYYGDNLKSIVFTMLIFGTIITGALEAVITHLLSTIILARLGYKFVKKTALYDYYINKIWAYILFLISFSYPIIYPKIMDHLIANVYICFWVTSVCILITFGFICLRLIGVVKFKKNITLLLVVGFLLLPNLMLYVYMAAGFIYNSTDLRIQLRSNFVKEWHNE